MRPSSDDRAGRSRRRRDRNLSRRDRAGHNACQSGSAPSYPATASEPLEPASLGVLADRPRAPRGEPRSRRAPRRVPAPRRHRVPRSRPGRRNRRVYVRGYGRRPPVLPSAFGSPLPVQNGVPLAQRRAVPSRRDGRALDRLRETRSFGRRCSSPLIQPAATNVTPTRGGEDGGRRHSPAPPPRPPSRPQTPHRD